MSTAIRSVLGKLLLACSLGGLLYAILLHCSDQGRQRDSAIFQLEQLKTRLRQPHPRQNILLGDSRALAVNFSGTLADAPVNLAFSNSGGLYPYIYCLQNYLENHPAPQRIYWSFIPLMLTDTWEIFKQPAPVGVPEIYRAARLYTLKNLLNPRDYPIFMRFPASSRAILAAKLLIDPEAAIQYLASGGRPADFSRNYNPASGALLFDLERQWHYTESTYLEQVPFVPAQQAIAFFEQFLELARQHQIQVCCFNMPIPRPIHEKRQQQGFYRRYFAILEDFRSRFPETFFYSDLIPAYDCDEFSDGSHLNKAGADHFEHETWPQLVRNFPQGERG
ncbi:DUF1574 family protein [Desulfuromonas thiophila]|uniref:DUF1574 domain-containing protein n=1 Tax=Desulfuromonas thiophila TaxID=57664 RepID=A0A1G7EX21_9BACT|nr:DUF1574 family protein [Desulfuromonas thiophila]SDE68209.1 Protein of unknown function [Desulfuromonas thiophila]